MASRNALMATPGAIMARHACARTLSVDGTAVLFEAEPIKDIQTPLRHSWNIYHDTKTKAPYTSMTAADASYPALAYSGTYEADLIAIGEFHTIEPMWEDDGNPNGGKWVLTVANNPALLDLCWLELTLALINEEIDEGDEICGAVVSLGSEVDRIQLWTRTKDDIEKLNGIGRKIAKLLLSDAEGIGIEFQYNTEEDRPPPNTFLSRQAEVSPLPSFHTKGGSPVIGPGEVEGSSGAARTAPDDGSALRGWSVGPLGRDRVFAKDDV
ncbi:translation initiation factor eIF 4e-like domain-containing protein [Russula earlei]|uniref:Translation initiation factor eIF 4e-like domain-containing protein n=1 Tax=Russula earlei TaxID=71964 RepID=A0ACC0UNN5_9AGAM|nr:translation initiation factor eIF 4e-like domain-containing protein [Russula earlei]